MTMTHTGASTGSCRAVLHSTHVILYRAIAELRAEATRTYAGYMWWLIQPLLMFGVYFTAFNYVLNVQRKDFAVFLFCGIVLWQWFAVSVQRCAGSLIASQSLMQQVNLHKSVFPLSIVLVNSVKFLVTLLILFAVLIIAGHTPGVSWVTLPLLLIIELLLIAGFGCFAAMISPFVPDFQHILATILQLAFFISGIIYDLSVLPERYQSILGVNPMAVLIEQTRGVLMDNTMPDLLAMVNPIVFGGLMLIVSFALLHRFDKVYPKLG